MATKGKQTSSVFHQIYRGERLLQFEGSFDQGLYELFFKAGRNNKYKLVEAFPEFFGEEVPEFEIYKRESANTHLSDLLDRM